MTIKELIKKYEGILDSASVLMRCYYLDLLKDLKSLDEPKQELEEQATIACKEKQVTITVEKMIERLRKCDKQIEIEEASFNQLMAEVEKNKFSPLLAMSYEDFFAWGYKPTLDGGCYTYDTDKNTDSPESRLSYLEYLMSKRNLWEGADEELDSVANVSYYCSNCQNGGVWNLQTESMVCKDCGSDLNGLYQEKLDEFKNVLSKRSITTP